MQQVEGFEAGDEFAFQQRLTDRCVHYKVVRVKKSVAIASAAIHSAIGRQCGLDAWQRIACCKSISEVQGIEGGEVAHTSLAVTPSDVARSTYVEVALLVLYVGVVAQCKCIYNVLVTVCLSLKHRVVNGVDVAGIGIHLPGPIALFVQETGYIICCIEVVVSFHVYGLIGIDSVCRVICYRLCYAAVVVEEMTLECVER